MSNRNKIRVSYLVSTRNRAALLDRCLRNVRDFITPEDELILMDGASTDDTAEVAKKHADIVTLFRSETDCGEAHGFNKGTLESRGRLIKWLTDDDYIYPAAMRKAICVMEEHPEIDAIQCGGECYEISPSSGDSRFKFFEYLPPGQNLAGSFGIALRYVPCGLGLLVKRRCIALAGLFDVTYKAVDIDYLSKLMSSQAVLKYLNVKLYRHVEYPHSGQRNVPIVLRDQVRAQLRSAAWAEARRGSHKVLADALNLTQLHRGDMLAESIWYAIGFRQSRLSYLRLLNSQIRLLAACQRIVGRVGLRLGLCDAKRHAPPDPGLYPTEEPIWDGSLR